MNRRLLAFVMTLALMLSAVGHLPDFDGQASAQPLAETTDFINFPNVEAANGPSAGVAAYDARCKNASQSGGAGGGCSSDAVAEPHRSHAPVRGLTLLRWTNAAERLKTPDAYRLIRPPISVS